MPPAISDEENSDTGDFAVTSDILPKKGRGRKPKIKPEPEEDSEGEEDVADPKITNGNAEEDDDEDQDEDDMSEDEFVVEKIFSHYIAADGEPRFEVKWEGWDKKSDRTWEPEENLQENAAEILQEYFKEIGGREKMFEQTSSALKGRKRGRQSNSATPAEKRTRKNGHPENSTPPASAKAVEWKPPSGSWDEEVDTVDMCQDEENGTFIVYLTWKNGKKTQHPKEVVYRRCPQKMLRFYERHIRISRDGGSPVAISSMN
ncbi:hypothetical protein J7T55_014876 [Diaporthe amygdali]|uniref:uncharacterized protein n=1 Tax=Phomopsis amygdali TaxID=1214568 RepID=UPI0022FDCFD6|nr:uncharacterized protein J7T55_014876 [Diaporthe amygdali]KAJ0110073.1 hypothetical protein J7T55_014876 [Diaporthe amygdali]